MTKWSMKQEDIIWKKMIIMKKTTQKVDKSECNIHFVERITL